ncbi:histidine kinase [Bacteroidales bacterium OttesenSCG-928-B11]|nr:histidine kinase [Bacteroidales bacterium OttesenSCG-928-E04]MDL2308690.1 histidine kinase [Bacteroidales bacterium OttesenSCG-928-C03]MDL2313123.1 histidine kinase [Bacteroidales bacterium OttesenSCG-928-B11]MDL2325962.1 histidine kinase [Bacteroidales bacterium OttesenSCG-928-A14]
MNFFESLKLPRTTLWWALIMSAIIIYPNIGEFMWSLFAPAHKCTVAINTANVLYFIYRYLFFVGLTFLLIRMNVKQAKKKLNERFWKSFLLAIAAYLIYVIIGKNIAYQIRLDCFTQMVILQFLIAWLVPILIGQIYYLTVIQQETQKEMERLKTENLQSRVDALSNQINPHFFFNSLNGLTALVADNRNEETLEYVNKLSNIFRYILQSEKKGLVKLADELDFLRAYQYLIEVRYSGKISFNIDVNEDDSQLQIPVLSLLPLIENIVKHNVIDSEHIMTVDINVSKRKELIVKNPIYPKYQIGESHGIGLSNLSSRYKLLMGKDIRTAEIENHYIVFLPLKKSEDESTDC